MSCDVLFLNAQPQQTTDKDSCTSSEHEVLRAIILCCILAVRMHGDLPAAITFKVIRRVAVSHGALSHVCYALEYASCQLEFRKCYFEWMSVNVPFNAF